MLTKEEKLSRRRERYRNETPEQRAKRKAIARRLYIRNKEKRLEQARALYNKNPKLYLERKKSYHQASPEKYLLSLARRRARKIGCLFNLDVSDIKIPEICPILGIKLVSVNSSWKERDFCPSLDRIDSTKGYEKGNVAVISFRANQYKSNMTKEIIENLYRYTFFNNET